MAITDSSSRGDGSEREYLMIDNSWQIRLIVDFGGSYTYVDEPDVPTSKSLLTENMEFLPGQASTRLGFAIAFNPNEAMSALYNWISNLGGNLVWYGTSGGTIRLAPLSSPTAQTVVAGNLGGLAATFANAGARLYVAVFLSTGLGATSGRVVSFQSAAYVSDKILQGPIAYVPSAPTEPAAGFITVGLHRLAYRIEYRSGFITRPSPDTSTGGAIPTTNTFAPLSFTAAGSKNLSWTLNTAWPTGAVKVHVLMTPVSNPNLYLFVPGATAAVVGGTTMSVTIAWSIPDDDLVAQAEDATDSLFFLTNAIDGTAPFNPSVVVNYGDRMVYITTILDNVGNKVGAAYVSDRNAYQQLNPVDSLIQIPGQRDIMTAVPLDGNLYLLGAHWTYQTMDNGLEPSQWPTPRIVDGSHGTLAPRGVLVSSTGTFAWVADQTGLYVFTGQYAPLPVSYYNTDQWNRINWTYGAHLQIKDDSVSKKVCVLAPLDASTTPSHMLTWDYTNGKEPTQVKFSLDTLTDISLGAIEIVENVLTASLTNKQQELWVGSSTANAIFRRTTADETLPYSDNGLPIGSVLETAIFPAKASTGDGQVFSHHGANGRFKGFGTMAWSVHALDNSRSHDLRIIPLETDPGKEYFRGFDINSEGCYHRFSLATPENLVPNPYFGPS